MDWRRLGIASGMTVSAILWFVGAGSSGALGQSSPGSPDPCPSPAVAAAGGSIAPAPSADPCQPGSYLVDLTNTGGSVRPDPGHYEGVGNVDCGFIGGTWQGSLDHGTPTAGPLVRLFSITQAPPPNVGVDTVNSTETPGDWAISGSEVSAAIAVTVQDLGDRAIIAVHASDEFQIIDGWLSCSSIVRG